MSSRRLTKERDVNGYYLSYTPVSLEDLGEIRRRVPVYLGNSTVKENFRSELTQDVRDACGYKACRACVSLEANGDAVAVPCDQQCWPTTEDHQLDVASVGNL